MKKIFAIVLVVCAMGVVLSGCSKSEEAAPAGGAATAGADGAAK